MTEFSPAVLAQSLIKATDEAKRQIRQMAEEASRRAEGDIKAAYPQGKTGNLRGRVYSRQVNREGAPAWKVFAAAPHVHLWQKGTKTRQYVSKNGVPHRTGQMPAGGPVFQRHAADARRAYLQQAEQYLNESHEV